MKCIRDLPFPNGVRVVRKNGMVIVIPKSATSAASVVVTGETP